MNNDNRGVAEEFNKKNVLIVDDEPGLLLSIECGFERQEQFKVLTAGNGEEALEVLTREEVDLLITDLQMPKMDGFQLLAKMNVDYPNVVNVAMTAFATPKIEEQLKSLGAYTFLSKPLDVDTLENCILSSLKLDL